LAGRVCDVSYPASTWIAREHPLVALQRGLQRDVTAFAGELGLSPKGCRMLGVEVVPTEPPPDAPTSIKRTSLRSATTLPPARFDGRAAFVLTRFVALRLSRRREAVDEL
jgi:hypothetical protein